jgi:hypothetical protein
MRLAGLKRHSQRLVFAKQVALANHFVDCLRAQPFRQRNGGAGIFEHGLSVSLHNIVHAL